MNIITGVINIDKVIINGIVAQNIIDLTKISIIKELLFLLTKLLSKYL